MQRRKFIKHAAITGASLLAGGRGQFASAQPATPAMGALSDHRIEKIEWFLRKDRFQRNVGPNSFMDHASGWGDWYDVRLITTNKGARGWAMAYGKKSDEYYSRYLGVNVADLFDPSVGLIEPGAQRLDIALHDLAGNILGQPVWRMIGGKGPRQLPIYSGAIYFEDVIPTEQPRGIEAVLSACRQDYALGYRYFKLKIGRGLKWMNRRAGLKRDIDVTKAVNETFPDCRILVDANDAYTVDEAIEYVIATADCNLYWLEELFRENANDLMRLREAMDKAGSKALIADGEKRYDAADPPTRWGGYTEHFVADLVELCEAKLVDVLLLDPGIMGFTRYRKNMAYFAERGILTSPHTWAWSPRPFYAATLGSGLGNVVIVEGIPAVAKGIDYSNYEIQNGNIIMSDEPGIGLKLERLEGEG